MTYTAPLPQPHDPARARPVTRIRVEMVAAYLESRPGVAMYGWQIKRELMPDALVEFNDADISRAVCMLRRAFGWQIETRRGIQGYILHKVGRPVTWPEELEE